MSERYYRFVFRDCNKKVYSIESFRDTDRNSAKQQAIVKSYKFEYFNPELSPFTVVSYRSSNK